MRKFSLAKTGKWETWLIDQQGHLCGCPSRECHSTTKSMSCLRAQLQCYMDVTSVTRESRKRAGVSGPYGIPSNAKAYALNVTVVPTGFLGYPTTWPTGQSQPYVSTLNSYAGTVVANAAIVPAGTDGAISVFVTANTDLIIDINGYFAP
jgi:hypothetical protein